MNLTGNWVRLDETLTNLEKMRETMDIPWVMRKLMRQMEKKFSIHQSKTVLGVYNQAKLLSSGVKKYVLDGKQHKWSMPSPLLDSEPVALSYAADANETVVCVIIYYTEIYRVVRILTRTTDRIDSTITLQKKMSDEAKTDVDSVLNSDFAGWHDVKTMTGVAVRDTEESTP